MVQGEAAAHAGCLKGTTLKRVAILVATLVMVLVLPISLVGVLLMPSGQTSPTERALGEIPRELIPLYQGAAATCSGLDWTVLAAIHKVETSFGTGPAVSSKGARGPTQFLPSTFAAYGVDGDGDGNNDINNVADAVFSAANLLCANGAGEPARLASAVWNFNHSQSYVSEVLTLASAYGVVALPAGVALASTTDLLDDPRVVLTPQARADLQAGIVDPRLVSLLSWIARRHSIGVTVFASGHSRYVEGTDRVSNHYYGRAADVFFVEGQPVSAMSLPARALVTELAGIAAPLRPGEMGHPFGAIGFPGGFTDADHADHIHIGFD